MNAALLLMITMGIILILFAVLFEIMSKKKKRSTDYYALFIIGLLWLALGFSLRSWIFGILGVTFAIAGLMNKNKWKMNRQTWNKLDKKDRVARVINVIFLVILVIVGIIFYVLYKMKILN
jgi:hypothetical protein